MQDWLSLQTLVSLMLGISLSAACGLRVFLPFLIIGTAADYGHLFTLPNDLQWLSSNQALIMLLIASVVEIFGYYIPWIDNLIDPFAFPLATIAGTLVTASALPADTNTLVQWTLAAIIGGGSAGLVKGATSLSRLGSTALSGGLANFLLSTAEWVGATLLTFLALSVPILAGVVVIAFLAFALFKAYQLFGKKFFSASNVKT
jgi:hypothetical protein